MTKRRKITLGIVLALVVVLIGADLYVGNYLVNYAIGRGGDGGNREVSLDVDPGADDVTKTIAANKASQVEANKQFVQDHPSQEIHIKNGDGLQLCADEYLQSNAANHKWVIALHGYRGASESLSSMSLAQHYYELGYNVLVPDLRACDDTDGEYVGMGWLDKDDILCWINWVVEQDPESSIVMHGISMGAATTMMTAGEDTPDNVKAFIEDCGYTSVWDIFSSELRLRFGLPEFPVLYTASAMSKVKAGYSFDEASALQQVSKCTKPMLFIHGTADNFIPYGMMEQLYQAKPGDSKKMVTAEGAGHGEAMYAMGDAYWNEVVTFLG